jgi:hypothetical protein
VADISIEALIGCGVLLAAGLQQWRKGIHRARLIEDVPTSKVRSAAQGVVELIGTCRPAAGLEYRAPISGEPCTWYRYQIEKRVKSGKSHSWHTVANESSGSDFVLEDETGRCTVHPSGATITTTHRKSWSFGTGLGTAESRIADLRSPSARGSGILLDVAIAGLNTRGRVRVTKWLLQGGDPLYVLGNFTTQRSDEGPKHELAKPSDSRRDYLISNMTQAQIIAKHRTRGKWGLAMFIGGALGYIVQAFMYLG